MKQKLLFKLFATLQLIIFLFYLSGCHDRDNEVQKAQDSYSQNDYARAFQQLMGPVKRKDPAALYAMGYMYYYGVGTVKDQDIGRSLMRQSAEEHYTPAIEALKIINQRQYNQYVPFENYTTTQNEGLPTPIHLRRQGPSS